MDNTEAIETPREAPYEPVEVPPEPSMPEIVRPTGISWVTLTLGLLCLGLAALVLTLQYTDIAIDWSAVAPIFVVGAGALLVIAGIASMMTKDRQGH